MKTLIYRFKLVAVLLLAAFAGSTFGQEETAEKAQGSRLVPPRISLGIPFDARDIALAKIDERGKMLRMIVPSFKMGSMTRQVAVTKERLETRTRQVVNEKGKTELQQYTVRVAYIEMEPQEVSALDNTAKDRFKVPIELVVAWQLDGTRIKADELRQRAAKPMHFFVTRTNPFTGIPPYFREALNPNMVVIFVGNDFGEKFSDGETPKEPNTSK